MNRRSANSNFLSILLITAVALSSSAAVVVDSFSGGALYGNSPFRGALGVTPQWQELGGSFIPNMDSRLTSLNVSIFAQPGTTGSARLTIYRYDQDPGASFSLGLDLGYAEVPLGNYGELVPFDFSSQNIQLSAGQTYLYVVSNPGATSFDGFENSWRANEYYSSPGMFVNGWYQFAPSFNYYTWPFGYDPHFEVLADPVPEPPPSAFLAIVAGIVSVSRIFRRQK
jgi:hypothetical protein